MSERKACVRCSRSIDAWARICPYCNWDQTQPAPPPSRAVAAPPPIDYEALEEAALKKKMAIAGAGVLLLFVAFGVGMLINRGDSPKSGPVPLESQVAKPAVPPPLRADTPLVPAGPGGIEQPITSAPPLTADGNATDAYQRTDATAVSALEYARMAQRARAERARAPSLVDPRSLRGEAWAQAPRRRPAPASTAAPSSSTPAAAAAARTRPIPRYQPIPPIRATGTAKLRLTIGPDGEVKEVDVQRPLERGSTAALVASVQRWRFTPATANGRPVPASYTVDIRFER
jgi:TonB family protein